MDQIKEFLRQAIKYRFWIAVVISALLPMIAYAVGSDPIKKKAAEQTELIKGAKSGVEKYASGVVPNDQYKPIVNEQTAVLGKDVNASWSKLYERQAPLLTWPEVVEKEFQEWGNKWPENVDASTVSVAIINYANVYPKQVSEVYKIFRPFDIMEGTGVVSAPLEPVLLKPATLEVKGSVLPTLGKVWAAQERLWIQRSLLEVINEVNKNAKDWDTAKIKQINLLDVGTTTSQDQISMAKGVQLAEAPPLDPPGTESAEAAPAADAGMGAEAGMMMPGMMGGGGQQKLDAVYYIQTESVQYKIMPFQISVLLDQNYLQEYLVALENSPMAIQISEFALAKPATRVVKPVKGNEMMWGGDMYGSGMMPGMMPGSMSGMTGFGGSMMPGMMPGMGMGSGMGMGMGMGMGGVAKKGIDARTKDRQKTRQEELEKAKKTQAVTIHDPYYNIIEVTVYGQARFYNAPPPPEAAEPSMSADGEAAPADPNAAPGETPKTEDAPKTEEGTPKAEDATKKAEDAPKAEDAAKKEDTPKAEDAPKADDAAKKEEMPKAEDAAKKEDAPKADDETSKKAEEAPKSEAPKADEAPKTR